MREREKVRKGGRKDVLNEQVYAHIYILILIYIYTHK